MEQHHWLVEILGKSAHPLDGLNFCHTGPGLGVKMRGDFALSQQLSLGLRDDGIIFGVNTNQRAVLLRKAKNAQNFRVRKLDVVGGEDLQRSMPTLDQRSSDRRTYLC